jgi:ribose transport system ATP-binding protein
VARAVFGADNIDAGTITIKGKETSFHKPEDAIRSGIGFCSEDRKIDGIIPDLSVRENLTLAALPTLTRSGIVDRKQQEAIVDRFIQRLGIKTAGPEQKIRELSGGNQQKVLLARWLCLNPRLLLLDEPTRGIDVGAKSEIQKLIEELAETGMGVLLISSELEEIIEGSDHVVVLRDGATVAEFARDGLSQNAILTAMAHGKHSEADPGEVS